MKILLSPAKTLDFNTKEPFSLKSEPVFISRANDINTVLKKKNPKQLKQLMHISDKLAELNWQRNQEWDTTNELRQSIFAFKGEVYLGLDAYSIPKEKTTYLQDTVRILSGQYGILKPFDQIKPYRLEMGTELKVNHSKNLYKYWDTAISVTLNTEIEQDETIVNLASNEYFKVINLKVLNAKVITPIFKDYNDGKYKVISFFAKKARGMMTRFAVDNEIKDVKQLKTFNGGGYAFDAKFSTESEWVFTR